MNAETIMGYQQLNPEIRTLRQITIDNATETDRVILYVDGKRSPTKEESLLRKCRLMQH